MVVERLLSIIIIERSVFHLHFDHEQGNECKAEAGEIRQLSFVATVMTTTAVAAAAVTATATASTR